MTWLTGSVRATNPDVCGSKKYFLLEILISPVLLFTSLRDSNLDTLGLHVGAFWDLRLLYS